MRTLELHWRRLLLPVWVYKHFGVEPHIGWWNPNPNSHVWGSFRTISSNVQGSLEGSVPKSARARQPTNVDKSFLVRIDKKMKICDARVWKRAEKECNFDLSQNQMRDKSWPVEIACASRHCLHILVNKMPLLDLELLQLLWLLMELLSDDDDIFTFSAPTSANTLRMLLEAGDSLGIEGPRDRAPNLKRERALFHDRLISDYFSPNALYPPHKFRRRFKMQRGLYQRVLGALKANNDFFSQKIDATELQGLSSLQKMLATMRMLAYDRAADELDEYLRIGEAIVFQCLVEFCKTVIQVFGPRYLRSPTVVDTHKILQHSQSRGWPGMLGSLDCMHWEWKNFPYAWQGQFQNRKKYKSVILEAMATYDLWIWHSFFGSPGANIDLNMFDFSPLFDELKKGQSPAVEFKVNDRVMKHTYYLTDGIYPKIMVFQQTISPTLTEHRAYYATSLEACRKDIERVFGVLQSRFHILCHPCRLWQYGIVQICIM